MTLAFDDPYLLSLGDRLLSRLDGEFCLFGGGGGGKLRPAGGGGGGPDRDGGGGGPKKLNNHNMTIQVPHNM